MISEVFNEDCIAGMKRYPDKYFDLAVVDPPYGLDIAKTGSIGRDKLAKSKDYGSKDWDKELPTDEYFNELFRVSKNQIIWGGNYFQMTQTNGWVIWKKMDVSNDFTPFEMAWTSFNKSRMFDFLWAGMWQQDMKNKEERIHPTQKPVKLYDWILHNYAKPNDKILDTHLGSQSSRIAAHKAGLDFTGFEIDKEYFEQGNKRYNQFISQLTIF